MRIGCLLALLLCAEAAPAQIIATLWGRRVPSSQGVQMADHALIYDLQRSVTVAWNGARLQEWDGRVWRTPAPTPAPIAAMELRGAYDHATRTALFFGGIASGQPVSLQWRWDGQRLLADGVQAPPARAGHALASYPGGALLFGGDAAGSGTNALLGDTWVWTGATWTQVSAAGPSPRRDHALAYSYHENAVYLFGGRDATGVLDDFWRYDVALQSWSRIAAAPVPAAREHAELLEGYGGFLLLIGGLDGGGNTIHEVQHYHHTLGYWQNQGGVIRCRPRNAAARDFHRDEILVHGGLNSSRRELWVGLPEPIGNYPGFATVLEYGRSTRLQLTTDDLPVVGSTPSIDFSRITPGTSAALMALALSPRYPPIPDTLQIAPLAFLALPAFPAPLGIPVPADPSQSGLAVFLQSVALTSGAPGSALEFSNSLRAVLGTM